MPEVITDNLDLWTSALMTKSTAGRGSNGKQEAYGITKLRELILELAVRGKLVPQDPHDEPATELLKHIAAEKARLIRDGKIKTPKALPDVADDEAIFPLPIGWSWAKLEQLAPMSLFDGDWIESDDQDPNGSIRLIQLADIGVDEFKDVSERFINDEAFERLSCTELHEGDILIARLPSPIGRACIFPGLSKRAITAVDVAILRLLDWAFDRYVVHAINSKAFRNQVEEFGKGATRFRISTGNLKTILVPVPPLPEQHRIVAKVDELMALCDQLEHQQTHSIEAHQTLVETLLGTLTRIGSQQEFSKAWARIASHFDTLFTTEASIDQLKQTILQLAIMGKLVPQDPNDEPASVLLERIAEERARLIEIGKLKRLKPLPHVSDEEASFDLPDGWAWARLQDVIDVRDGTHDSPKDAIGDDTYPLVTSSNFKNGEIDFDGARRISAEDHFEISKRSFVEKYDILFSMIGGNLGNQVMVLDDQQFSVKNVALFKYYSKDMTSPFFIKKLMEHLALDLQEKAIGGAQPFVSLGFLRNLVFALPPFEEQHRIVAKVDELMALCDALKARLADAQTTQIHLADAIVEQAVA